MTHTGLNLNSLHHCMQLGSLLNAVEDSLDSDELMRTQIWALQDELCRKASKVARLNGQPMAHFDVSSADLEKLANNKQRLKRLQMKLSMLDSMLAEGQGSAAEPSPRGQHETAALTTNPVAPILPCPHLAAAVPLHSSNESSSAPSSNTATTKRRRRVLDLDYYVNVYNELISERSSQQPSSSAQLRAPAQSTGPFGPLDPATQPLLEIDPGVSAAIRNKRNTKNRLENPGSRESPQYLWSWIVYFIRHIGRPALAAEVREAFHIAHPKLLRVGGRQIGLGEGQEWLSVPAAMAAAFPNGELAIAHRPPKRRKGAAAGTYEQDLASDELNSLCPDTLDGCSADALDGGGSNEAWGLFCHEYTPGHVTAIVAGSGDAGGVAGSGGGASASGGGGAAAGGATAADNAEKTTAVAAAVGGGGEGGVGADAVAVGDSGVGGGHGADATDATN